jgi:hypothetical protein
VSSRFLSKNIKIDIYRTVSFAVVMHGCEIWSITEEGTWVRKFENRVLRRIFGPKRGDVIGEYRKLHNEELNL